MVTYRLIVENVEPSGTELPARVETVLIADGEETGASLLRGLATGRTTIQEFNDATLHGESDDADHTHR